MAPWEHPACGTSCQPRLYPWPIPGVLQGPTAETGGWLRHHLGVGVGLLLPLQSAWQLPGSIVGPLGASSSFLRLHYLLSSLAPLLEGNRRGSGHRLHTKAKGSRGGPLPELLGLNPGPSVCQAQALPLSHGSQIIWVAKRLATIPPLFLRGPVVRWAKGREKDCLRSVCKRKQLAGGAEKKP